jgi:acyl transferase domain-containing protein
MLHSDAVQPVPCDRWDADHVQQGSKQLVNGQFGGFVLDWVTFDAEAFAITPAGQSTLSCPFLKLA